MELSDVSSAVDAAFLVTGAGLASWPDPRPDRSEPRPEEYSRCPDPGKYRIVLARADAWATALAELGLGSAARTAVLPEWQAGRARPASRAVVVEPVADSALPLLFLHWDAGPEWAAMVEVLAGDPPVSCVVMPDCGCDACDDGSEPMLRALDEAIVPVLTGDWLHLEAPGLSVTAAGARWSASGSAGGPRRGRVIDGLIAEAKAGRSPHAVVRAGRWW